jgi:hypothetical protein
VDADETLQEIIKAQRLELLDTKKFAELKKLYEEKYLQKGLTNRQFGYII